MRRILLCLVAFLLASAFFVSASGADENERREREYSTHMYTHTWKNATEGLDCSAEGTECTLSQLKIYFGCSSGERPVHDQKTWQYLRQTYHDIVGGDKSTIGPPNRSFNGFAVPYYVDQSPGRGRGLFAARDIRKGSLIWTASRTAEFEDAETYRSFLFTIPAELACDVMMWAYVSYGSEIDGESNEDDEEEESDDEEDDEEGEQAEEESSTKIMVDLDESSFCNDGGKKSNMDWDAEAAALYPDNSDWRTFAVKDVKEGEELLCNYSGFFEKEKWASFGL